MPKHEPPTLHLRLAVSPQALELYAACYASVAASYGQGSREPAPTIDRAACAAWLAVETDRDREAQS